jgi:hypothetical protein
MRWRTHLRPHEMAGLIIGGILSLPCSEEVVMIFKNNHRKVSRAGVDIFDRPNSLEIREGSDLTLDRRDVWSASRFLVLLADRVPERGSRRSGDTL